jgi:ABC-type multidrug transport system ATPase subunit
VQVLEELGMEERTLSAPLQEMSWGMQQKISIARADARPAGAATRRADDTPGG